MIAPHTYHRPPLEVIYTQVRIMPLYKNLFSPPIAVSTEHSYHTEISFLISLLRNTLFLHVLHTSHSVRHLRFPVLMPKIQTSGLLQWVVGWLNLHVLKAVYYLKLSGINKANSQRNNAEDLSQCHFTQSVCQPTHLTRVYSVADLTCPLWVRWSCEVYGIQQHFLCRRHSSFASWSLGWKRNV